MQKQDPTAIACFAASSDKESKDDAAATRRSGTAHKIGSSPPAPEDFEFCVLSSGGLALAGEENMCAADEVFSGGKLLPLRPFPATLGDASALMLLRLDSGATSSSTSSRSSSSCVSRSTSSKSLPNKSASSMDTTKPSPPPRRSVSSSVFYAHPSPSPRPPCPSAARRSTGSAARGVIRLGVVGAPEMYTRRLPSESRWGGSQSASFEQENGAGTRKVVDRTLGLGLLGAGLVCSCSPDAVAPVGTVEAAAAEARWRRKKADGKKKAAKQSTSRRSRILSWLEELSMPRTKNVV